jgi:hypothetical protein
MSESLQQRIEKIRIWAKDPDRATSRILAALPTVFILVAIALWIVWIVPKHQVRNSFVSYLDADIAKQSELETARRSTTDKAKQSEIDTQPNVNATQIRTDNEKALELENEFRKTLTQIVLSIFGLFILYLTWKRARAGDRTVEVMEQGHITDRYTRAIEQLGKFAYVRQNAPAVKPGETPETPPPRKPRTDIQAILTVLGRRPIGQKRERPDQQLDLSSTHLQNAQLERANLKGANFRHSNLKNVNLWDARLENASLLFANLEYANLWTAKLQGAMLNAAKLSEASLASANLEDTYLGNADLRNARGVEPDQVKAANFWEKAHYSPDFRAALGLPPEDQTSPPPDSPTP